MISSEKQSGFTIIEVTLVLTISSLLLVLMMTGITLAVQRQRFSDSVNGTQSFLQAQFSETQNISNNRTTGSCGDPNSPGDLTTPDLSIRGASPCVLLGKLIEIKAGSDESTITAYEVIATDASNAIIDDSSLSNLEVIRSINPTVMNIDSSKTSYIIPWGAEVSNIRDAADTTGGSPVEYLVLLRSPRSGIIYVYKIQNIPGGLLSGPTLLSSGKNDNKIREIQKDSVKMCLNSADLSNFSAMLEVIPIGSQDGIVTHFDDAAKDTYGC